ncbi:MAG: DNA polymerase IV [Alphaproteobacteria bacterium]|nr:DNA polymerase IV [Alphaproteobacteria bacterium]
MDDRAPGLCRECLSEFSDLEAGSCRRCGSPRVVRHPELLRLALAHVDCDAFYAAIEKRDNPALADRPLIVGGGRRGVVSTACYIARRFGVHSAMPMFKALQLCPHATVIRPDMAKYAAVSHEVQAIFLEATPLVEPVSLDEAYLDLTGTEALHRASPAAILARIAHRIEQEIAITVSIGLSYNKFLAKLASEMDKPRGFGVTGRGEAEAYLAARPVRVIPGVGRVLAQSLEADGFVLIGDLQRAPAATLAQRYGAHGARLAALARGVDERTVEPERESKQVSAETTFDQNLADGAALRAELWPLCETVSRRLKRANIAGRTVVLKLRTASFKILTRRRQLPAPTQLADEIFRVLEPLLARETVSRSIRYRLIGAGVTDLVEASAVEAGDLFGEPRAKRAAIEKAIDAVRDRFGDEAIGLGRSLPATKARPTRPR